MELRIDRSSTRRCAEAGIKFVRFPGGSESDAYHWEDGGSICHGNGLHRARRDVRHLMSHAARPLDLDIAITLDYGSNPACKGGGDPSEAAAWVAYAKKRGYHVPYWTVGNEIYGSWEYDLHAEPHDPNTYSDAVRTGFYPAVKNADAERQARHRRRHARRRRLERGRAARSPALRFRRAALLSGIQHRQRSETPRPGRRQLRDTICAGCAGR